MSGVVSVAALLLLAVVLVVLPPLLAADRRFAPASRSGRRRAVLESHREELYLALRDAELDWRTGKLTEEDHRSLRERLLAEAAGTLRELDELEESGGAVPDEKALPVTPPRGP